MKETRQILLVVLGMLISSFFTTAHSGPPRCYLNGVLMTGAENEKQTLADMLRLHFDADTKEKCDRMMTSYCYANVKAKGYMPAKLAGSFKPDCEGREEIRYAFSAECKLVPVE